VGRAPEADPSVEATIESRETTGPAAALSPPVVLPVLAPASAEAVAALAVEPPVTADAEMAEAPLLEAGYRKPAPLAEEVPYVPTAGGADALEKGSVEPRPILGSGVSRSGSGPVVLRNPSSFLTMSERSSLGASFVSVPRQRWGRFGRPWRSFLGTFPGSSR
jgi:hypothetical protein